MYNMESNKAIIAAQEIAWDFKNALHFQYGHAWLELYEHIMRIYMLDLVLMIQNQILKIITAN